MDQAMHTKSVISGPANGSPILSTSPPPEHITSWCGQRQSLVVLADVSILKWTMLTAPDQSPSPTEFGWDMLLALFQISTLRPGYTLSSYPWTPKIRQLVLSVRSIGYISSWCHHYPHRGTDRLYSRWNLRRKAGAKKLWLPGKLHYLQ